MNFEFEFEFEIKFEFELESLSLTFALVVVCALLRGSLVYVMVKLWVLTRQCADPPSGNQTTMLSFYFKNTINTDNIYGQLVKRQMPTFKTAQVWNNE